ncbi:MAG: PQQ-binding-like beta-propeller repeat protein [Melioribacteraceae bacterium]|nr:PQQ-binding-like beta-propeller repeat protein [Melioribacteraceae bacterium]MCO6474478.1 PQQ-like beta-propeller repeat protein [Melioribacteraceae bacterium]MDD3559013.1 PQQ-binding-like beta-propeller repeat protein [Melioribacteraceae bacterium]
MNRLKNISIIFLLSSFVFSFIISCDSTDPKPPEKPPGYQEDIPWPSLADSPWPIIHGDPQSTGRVAELGPQYGEIEFRIEFPSTEFSHKAFQSPIIGPDSTIYIIYNNFPDKIRCYLFAISHLGFIKWKVPINADSTKREVNVVTSSLLIDKNGIIHLFDWGGYYYGINISGEIVWKKNISKSVLGTFSISKNGLVIAATDQNSILCFDLYGNLEWEKKYTELDRNSSQAITFSPDGNSFYAKGNDLSLLAFNLGGELKWKYNYGGQGAMYTAPVVDNLGNIYIYPSFPQDSTKRGLFSLNSNGYIRFRVSALQGIAADYDHTIDTKGNIYVSEGYLNSVSYEGQLKWTSDEISGGSNLVSDLNNNVYLVSQTEERVKSIDENGILNWSIKIEGYTTQTPALGNNGRIYFGAIKNGTDTFYFYSIR